jgi:hypothetical protein
MPVSKESFLGASQPTTETGDGMEFLLGHYGLTAQTSKLI